MKLNFETYSRPTDVDAREVKIDIDHPEFAKYKGFKNNFDIAQLSLSVAAGAAGRGVANWAVLGLNIGAPGASIAAGALAGATTGFAKEYYFQVKEHIKLQKEAIYSTSGLPENIRPQNIELGWREYLDALYKDKKLGKIGLKSLKGAAFGAVGGLIGFGIGEMAHGVVHHINDNFINTEHISYANKGSLKGFYEAHKLKDATGIELSKGFNVASKMTDTDKLGLEWVADHKPGNNVEEIDKLREMLSKTGMKFGSNGDDMIGNINLSGTEYNSIFGNSRFANQSGWEVDDRLVAVASGTTAGLIRKFFNRKSKGNTEFYQFKTANVDSSKSEGGIVGVNFANNNRAENQIAPEVGNTKSTENNEEATESEDELFDKNIILLNIGNSSRINFYKKVLLRTVMDQYSITEEEAKKSVKDMFKKNEIKKATIKLIEAVLIKNHTTNNFFSQKVISVNEDRLVDDLKQEIIKMNTKPIPSKSKFNKVSENFQSFIQKFRKSKT